MKTIVSIAFLSCVSFVAAGCTAEVPNATGVDPASAATADTSLLAQDDEDALADDMDADEVDSASDELASGLAGAAADALDDMADAADLDGVDAVVKTNPGKFFSPAACLTSTRLGKGNWSHVLKDCKGPKGRFTYSGEITAQWSLKDGVLSVERDVKNLVVQGKRVTATVSGEQNVSFSRDKDKLVITRHRVGDLEGTIARNKEGAKPVPFEHKADFTTTFNRKGKEYTREGHAESQIGKREVDRTVSGYKAEGGRLACPSAGQVVISRKMGEKQLTIDFLGGQDVKITGSRGRSVTRQIKCGEQES
jgi:hypothetical protein